MDLQPARNVLTAGRELLTRLLRNRAGNTLMIVAAAVVPILGILGGAIDMGRSYLSESQLQQACDAGVLAARKRLGSAIAADGEVPDDAAAVGDRFFNLNFRTGSYGTEDRSFDMTLEDDYSISGAASVNVPTTVMAIFGFGEIPVAVECEAKLNFNNTDVMMVLDTTGSMNQVNSGDTSSRIAVLRTVVKNFHAQLEGSKTPGTRIRYGFVPYSVNVNVGFLLKGDWVVDNWKYNGRVAHDTGLTKTGPVFDTTYTYVSGATTANVAFEAASCPADTTAWTTIRYWKEANGRENWEYVVNGNDYTCGYADGGKVDVASTTYVAYQYIYSYWNKGNKVIPIYTWLYKPVEVDTTFVKGATASSPLIAGWTTVPMNGTSDDPTDFTAYFRGCIEERATYEIADYTNVDLTRALDLDIDLVPDPSDPDTQWRPQLNDISFVRSYNTGGWGSFTPGEVTSDSNFLIAGSSGLAPCPTPARKLGEMNASDVASYVDSLVPGGNTYHDIGMIWGGRLLSPTGIFAEENMDVNSRPTSRHMIFLTDGETATRDLAYSSYGIEPLDQRRWNRASPAGGLTLNQVVENRFTVACNQVKSRNITVWVISFGTDMTDMLKNCAGDGHWFQANNATDLGNIFSKIATAMGDLRISR